MEQPLVSIICVCCNQAALVGQTLASVVRQTHENIQLIIVDDGSTDQSVSVIQQFRAKYPVQFFQFNKSRGAARAFNAGLKVACGKYIVDAATGDVMMPDRIEKQVKIFEKLDQSYGVVFTDAVLVNEKAQSTGTFYARNAKGRLTAKVASGYVYLNLLAQHCVCRPTTMVRKTVYDQLNGYDEKLTCKDFDFFVRTARRHKYFYLNEPLTRHRQITRQGAKPYSLRDTACLASTLKVCRKAARQNQFEEENQALAGCVRQKLKQALLTKNRTLVAGFAQLLSELSPLTPKDRLWLQIAQASPSLLNFYRQHLRFGKVEPVGGF